ncbi:MAG: HD domain-containing protein [bacterium]|nr:HD domain-containing protein [bacterium]
MERHHYEKPEIIHEKKLPTEELGRKIEAQKELAFIGDLLAAFPEGSVYVVGGTVRDAMMGKLASKDYDLVIAGIPLEKLDEFFAPRGSLEIVGRNFGVLKFTPHDSELEEAIDIALPRRETAAGTGGRKDFDTQADHTMSIEDDLSRRDFTINAMAWDCKQHQVVDPFNGLLDLEEKKIRAVRNPKQRFQEDYSRMLRGLRFAVKLGCTIEKNTWEALRELMPRINDEREVEIKNEAGVVIGKKIERVTPYETIAKEFITSLKADPVRTLDFWDEADAIREILPELLTMKGCEQSRDYHSEGDVWTHTRLLLAKLMSKEFQDFFNGAKPDGETILATLFHDIAKPKTQERKTTADGKEKITFYDHESEGAKMVAAICERLHFSAASKVAIKHENIVWLVNHHLFPNHPPEHVRKTTLEKMFFNPNVPGEKLLHVAFADASTSIREDGTVDLERLRTFREELATLAKIFSTEKKSSLAPPLLNGNEVMKLRAMPAGRAVGTILSELREQQLNGAITTRDEATLFVQKFVMPS